MKILIKSLYGGEKLLFPVPKTIKATKCRLINQAQNSPDKSAQPASHKKDGTLDSVISKLKHWTNVGT